jgi:hypothetical protein
MMLTVRGGNAFQKKLAAAAVDFAKCEMLSKIRTLDIILKIRKFTKEEGNVVGWCIYEDDDKVKHREFTIEVSGEQGIAAFIKTIMHEMVHVKQYALAEMRESYGNDKHRIYWIGTDHTKTAYTKSPWEKEAYRLQDKLYEKFMKEAMSDMI